ncbi:hypothetical protein C882_3370 [Caenispirillum salinarum AK4]|uniref:Uncharacterized protein n=1 Tax=Caenispirillum salinarum AK4 TaxID=1238182 RepID=K9GIZ7_9PROT|nr:hypothetical protein [Caenispirillum salinarum]EKV25955.1 hypothetical protein C882_3370 [Caenispirillum salinarum AK4]
MTRFSRVRTRFRFRPALALAVGVAALPSGALGQEAGGVGLFVPPEAGAMAVAGALAAPMAPPPVAAPVVRPTNVAAANPARLREGANRQAVALIRGDGGYLDGFFRGQPVAASRQPPPEPFVPNFFTFIDAPFIVNTFESDITVELATGTVEGEDSDGGEIKAQAGVAPELDALFLSNQNSIVNVAVGNNNTATQEVTITD